MDAIPRATDLKIGALCWRAVDQAWIPSNGYRDGAPIFQIYRQSIVIDDDIDYFRKRECYHCRKRPIHFSRSPSFLSQFAQHRVVLCGCNRDSQPVRQRDQARISHSYSLGQRVCVAARHSHRSRSRNDNDRFARPLAFCSLKILNRLKLETLLAESRLADQQLAHHPHAERFGWSKMLARPILVAPAVWRSSVQIPRPA